MTGLSMVINVVGYVLALILLVLGLFIFYGVFRMITHYPKPLVGDEGMALGIVAMWTAPFVIGGFIVGWFCDYRLIPWSMCTFTLASIVLCFLTGSLFAKRELTKLEIPDPFFLCAEQFMGRVGKRLPLRLEARVSIKEKSLQGAIVGEDGRRHLFEDYDKRSWKLDNGYDFELIPEFDNGGSIGGTDDWSKANSATAIIRQSPNESFFVTMAFSKSCLPEDVRTARDAMQKFTRKELLFRRWYRTIFE